MMTTITTNANTKKETIMKQQRDSRNNKPYDNDFVRVIDRARKFGFKPAYFMCIDTVTERVTFVDECDLHEFERENNIGLRWRISPIFNREECDINGFPL